MADIKLGEATDNQDAVLDNELLVRISKALKGLTHGTVTIVVQDCKVVQIDKTEKVRLR